MTDQGKSMGLFFSISILMGLLLLWWSISFPEFKELSDIYFKVFALAMTLYTLSYLDRTFRFLPAEALPILSGGITKIVVVSAATVALIIAFQSQGALSVMPMVAAVPNASQRLAGLGAYTSLFIFGFVVAYVEEKLFGGVLRTSLQELIGQIGFDNAKAFVYAAGLNAVLFAGFHFYVININQTLILAAFLFRLIVDFINMRLGCFMPSLLIHTAFNSFIVGLVFGLPAAVWLIPPLFYVAAFTFIPDGMRSL